MVKNPAANAGDIRDAGSIPGSGRSLGEGNGNPIQCSCLENPMDRGAWQVTKSRTRLKRLSSSSSSSSSGVSLLTLVFPDFPVIFNSIDMLGGGKQFF